MREKNEDLIHLFHPFPIVLVHFSFHPFFTWERYCPHHTITEGRTKHLYSDAENNVSCFGCDRFCYFLFLLFLLKERGNLIF